LCRENDCALEAIKGELTLAEISSRYDVHATQVNQWKQQAVTGSPGLFIHKTDYRGIFYNNHMIDLASGSCREAA